MMSPHNTIDRKSKTWLIAYIVLSILFWLWSGLVVGAGITEVAFFILVTILTFGTQNTRQFLVAFLPLCIYLIGYNSLKILHKYSNIPIHNENLYEKELSLFGFMYNGKEVIPCEYFVENTHAIFDFISGAFYITWMPFPLIFGLIAFFAGKRLLVFNFWTCFLIANLFGFIGYIFYPAAPPWYFLTYGAEIIKDTSCSAAGLARFDQLVGMPLYEGMYSQGTDTFGAMPSMHAAFPLILVYYSIKFKNKWLTGLFLISLVSIWFGAVYSNHHYIIDVIIGILCGIIAIILTETMVNRTFMPAWYEKAMEYIQSTQKK